MIIIMAIYIAQLQYKYAILCCIIITPAVAQWPHRPLKALQGINSYQVPIYYIGVDRDCCGQNALSTGIHTK